MLVGAAFWISTLSFLRRAVETTGTVVGHKTINSPRGGSTHPVVEFQTPDGKTISFIDNASAGALVQVEGNTVKVAYDPKNPERARIKKFSALYLVPILVIIVGAGILLAGVPVFAGPMTKIKDILEKIIDKIPGWL
jgi:hypothetical protein